MALSNPSPRPRQRGPRRKLPAVFGLLAASIVVLVAFSSWHRAQVDDARSAQAVLNRIGVRTLNINTLSWTALQSQKLTPELEAQMRTERHGLPDAVLTARLHAYHTPAVNELWPALDRYIASAGQEWTYLQVGNFEQAKKIGFEEVSPNYDQMQHQVQVAIDAEGAWAESRAMRARNELLASAVLAAAALLVLFLRIQRQEHLGQLERAERTALEESEERFRALTEQSTDIILITDPSGRTKYASPSVHAVLSVRGEDLVGTVFTERVHPDDRSHFTDVVAAPEDRVLEFRLRHEDGSWLDFECSVRHLADHKHIAGIVFNARDITERKRAQEELLFNATHDALTGLPNRSLFLGRLQSVVDRAHRRPHQAAAVLFVDIDDFKVVNDCYGHASGDLLIKEVSNRLRACMRSDGTIARLGGDEFTVLVEDVRDPSDAIRVAQRIQASFQRPFLLVGQEVFKTASIGIALTSPEISAETVMQNADIAMYRAKDQGKACSELFDRTMHEQVMGRLVLEAKLRYALQNEELELHYQPIVSVASGEVQGFEALLRWQPAESNPIPPATFVPVAEQCGLIVPISVWCLQTACMEAVRWSRLCPGGPPPYVSINISSRHFSHASFIGDVGDALKQSGIGPDLVIIELTESLAMSDVSTTEQTMAQLRELGVKLSIDDFGTGYSSLSYLRRFPVDTLKIDQSFVATMDAENYAIVTTIVGLARNLELNVVAEGVETTDQHQLLALAGCASAQGFLFSRPMPPKDVPEFIESNRANAGRGKKEALSRSSSAGV